MSNMSHICTSTSSNFRNQPTVLACNTLDIGILFSVFSVSVPSVFYGILSQYFSQLLLLVVHNVYNQLKHFVDPNHKIKRKINKQT